jgi:hypothetical protein
VKLRIILLNRFTISLPECAKKLCSSDTVMKSATRHRGQKFFVEIENAETLRRDIIHLILTAGRAGIA